MSTNEGVSGQALPVGCRIEEFEIRGVLGSGGFGITYLAWDSDLKREVVIKENLPMHCAYRDGTMTVRPKTNTDEDTENYRWSMESFEREAETLSRFDHPNIVRILRRFKSNGTAYFVMPYVPGKSFKAIIDEQVEIGEAFSESALRELMLPLLGALEALHAISVFHRDIKPANILLADGLRPILIDFGAARMMISEKSHTVVESAGFTPFEQLQSSGSVGPWSDLYALGGTFYTAIHGKPPPRAADRVRKDPIVRLASSYNDSYSPAFLEAIDWSLAFDEHARPQSVAQFRERLGGATAARKEDHDKKGHTEGDDEKKKGAHEVVPWWRKHAVLLAAGALGAVGAVILSIVLTFALPRGKDSGVERAKVLLAKNDVATAIESLRKSAARGSSEAQWQLARLLQQSAKEGDKEAFPWLEKAAAQEDPTGMALLGSAFELGKGTKADLPRAIDLYRRAAERDGGVGTEYLARAYNTGAGVPRDPDRAAALWRESKPRLEKESNAGNVLAQVVLAEAHLNGHGVPQDASESFRWYRKAAEQGDLFALNAMGYFFLTGKGVAANEYEAAKWFRKAAERGSAYSQRNMGRAFENGSGVEKNPAEARKWYEMAIAQNDPEAMYRLGVLYQYGTGGPADIAKAVQLFQRAGNLGSADAMNDLGCIYSDGLGGVAKNQSEAVSLFRKAAENNSLLGQLNYAICLYYAKGITRNYEQAFNWFKKAASAGSVKAKYYVGVCYMNGKGVPPDEAEGIKWLRAAAEAGFASAQNDLGYYFMVGRGVPKDGGTALNWLKLAASQKENLAYYNIGILHEEGNGVPKSSTEALKWFMLAAEAGYSAGQFKVGWYHLNGIGTARNDDQGRYWTELAARQGDPVAQNNMGWIYHSGRGVPVDYRKAMEWYSLAAAQGEPLAKMNTGDLYYYGQGVPRNTRKGISLYQEAARAGLDAAKEKLRKLGQSW